MSYNPFSLENKTILVTGASSGIGHATALECSKMGANVIIVGRNRERLQDTFENLQGDNNMKIEADLTNYQEIENLVGSIPKVDGTVLCAGKGETSPVMYSSREKFDEVFNINFFSTVEILRLLYKKKKIVNINLVRTNCVS